MAGNYYWIVPVMKQQNQKNRIISEVLQDIHSRASTWSSDERARQIYSSSILTLIKILEQQKEEDGK